MLRLSRTTTDSLLACYSSEDVGAMRELESFYNTQIDEMPMVSYNVIFGSMVRLTFLSTERCRPHLSGEPPKRKPGFPHAFAIDRDPSGIRIVRSPLLALSIPLAVPAACILQPFLQSRYDDAACITLFPPAFIPCTRPCGYCQ